VGIEKNLVVVLIKIIINNKYIQVSHLQKHQEMVPKGDLFQLVLGAE
jgi:hypothetical protein